jgi:hypothetical protein
MIQKYVLNILPDDLLKYTDTIQYDCCVHLRSGYTVGVINLQYMPLKTEYYFNAIDNVLKDNLTVNIVYEDKKLDTFFLLIRNQMRSLFVIWLAFVFQPS